MFTSKFLRKITALSCVALGAAALAGCSRDDLPATSFSFSSPAGEYIGQGVNASYAPSAFKVSVQSTSADVIMNVSGTNSSGVAEWWRARISAPAGQTLHTGTFTGAQRIPTGLAPLLDISGDGRGCNADTGQFTIYQFKTDSSGNVVQLDAEAKQYCDNSPLALTAELRLNAKPMDLTLTSDAGDYVGQGASKAYFGDTSTFGLQSYGSNGVNYSASGQGDNWRALITPPAGGQLTKGATYSTTWPADANNAGLDFFGNGRSCDPPTGSLTINDIQRDVSGNVTALNATFVQHCENTTASLHGTIRYNA